ncbi:MAG TPA: low molecular weight protein-tyrosine-phosphatase [Gammaproteobacteria bacterium]|nr:low molecular weight protein-tyrosine-phosphatase [Gammaproteobacteria bacterium]
MTRVLFICMGNICRSPLAEAALRFRARERHIAVEARSAATHSWHVGEGAEARAIAAGRRRGYLLSGHRARQAVAGDFLQEEFILAMDRGNLARLRRFAPARTSARIGLLLDYAEETDTNEVPDPYYGGEQVFERALDLIDTAVDGFLRRLAAGPS